MGDIPVKIVNLDDIPNAHAEHAQANAAYKGAIQIFEAKSKYPISTAQDAKTLQNAINKITNDGFLKVPVQGKIYGIKLEPQDKNRLMDVSKQLDRKIEELNNGGKKLAVNR